MMLVDRGVLLIWIIVRQGPTVLAVGAARVVWLLLCLCLENGPI